MDMSDLTQLTDAEIDLVSGGIYQANYSDVDQYARASNYGNVTATASGSYSVAAASGASASNLALVAQSNSVRFYFF